MTDIMKEEKMAENNKTKSKMSKDDIISYFFLVLFITIDSFCFFLLFEATEAFGIVVTLVFGVLSAGVTNILSYLGSYYGVGHRGRIKNVMIDVVQKARKEALVVSLIIIPICITAQFGLSFLRYAQIRHYEQIFNQKEILYEEYIRSEDFLALSASDKMRETRDRKPLYNNGDSDKTLDWISCILPWVTSIGSFALGIKFSQPFTKLEQDLKEAHEKLELARIPIKTEKEKVVKYMTEECARLSEEEKSTRAKTDADIERIRQVAGRGHHDLKEAFYKKNDRYIAEFMDDLNQALKEQAPRLAMSDVEALYRSLYSVASQIHMELLEFANHPDDLADHKIEIISKYHKQRNELESPFTGVFDNKGEV